MRPHLHYELESLVTFQFTHPGRGATYVYGYAFRYFKVSIHAPREGCDSCRNVLMIGSLSFNSRTPGGVRLWRSRAVDALYRVSIHAPREGCDPLATVSIKLAMTFQFTHPGRGATARPELAVGDKEVSIHAPREGCDSCARYSLSCTLCFNSRTPGGVRPQ